VAKSLVSDLFVSSFLQFLKTAQDRISNVARTAKTRGSTGPGRDRTTSGHLVCYFIQPSLPVPYTGGGSVLTVGDGHHQGGQNQNRSRAFLHLIMSSWLVTSQTDVNLPINLSRDHLGPRNQSSTSIPPTLLELQTNGPGFAGADLHDGGRNASRPDLPNTGGEALLRQKSRKDTSGTNVGRTSNNASRGCHTSPDLELF